MSVHIGKRSLPVLAAALLPALPLSTKSQDLIATPVHDQENATFYTYPDLIDLENISKESNVTLDQLLRGDGVIRPGEKSSLLQAFCAVLPVPYETREFNKDVERAVKSYQRVHGLKITGEIDQLTAASLLSSFESQEVNLGKKLFKSSFFIKLNTEEACAAYLMKLFDGYSQPGRIPLYAYNFESNVRPNEYHSILSLGLRGLKQLKSQFKPRSREYARINYLLAYLPELTEALESGIDHPLRLTRRNLQRVLENYRNPDRSSEQAIIIQTSDDHNGAFYNQFGYNNLVENLFAMGLNVRFVSIYSDKEIATKPVGVLLKDSEGKPEKAAFMLLAFHGHPKRLHCSRGFSDKDIISIDEELLESLSSVIKERGTAIVYSCSGASGGANADNVVNLIAHACNATVAGSEIPCNMYIGEDTSKANGIPIKLPIRKSSGGLYGWLDVSFFAVQKTLPKIDGKNQQARSLVSGR